MVFMNTSVTRGPRRAHRDRHRHGHRDRPHRRPAQPHRGRQDAAAEAARPADHVIAGLAGIAFVAMIAARPGATTRTSTTLFIAGVALAVVGDPDRPARRRHDAATPSGRGAGRAERHRQATALGRDARLRLGDLLRQDRHAHPEPDDGAEMVMPGQNRFTITGEGYGTDGRDHARRRRRRSTSTVRCCRWRCAPTPRLDGRRR